MRSFLNFMNTYRVSEDLPYTHVSKDPQGKYFLDPNNRYQMPEFWEKYKNAIVEYQECIANKRRTSALTFLEMPKRDFGPFRIDFDFRSPLTHGPKRRYTHAQVNGVIKFVQGEIEKTLDAHTPKNPKVSWCVLLEKTAPRNEDGHYKDGFHLHFPFYIIESWLMDEITLKLKNFVANEKIFDECEYLHVEKCVDNVSTKPWMLYGSAKKSSAEPFLATRFFTSKINQKGYVVREPDVNNFFSEFLDQNQGETALSNLPMLLSIINCGSQTPLASNVVGRSPRTAQTSKKTEFNRDPTEIMNDLPVVQELLDMISDERAEEYEEWMNIGWCLYCIGDGHEQYLDEWKKFSARCPEKYNESACETQWKSMKNKGKTIASLRKLAKDDNPKKYASMCRSREEYLIDQTLITQKPNPGLVALFVHELYKDRFICSDSSARCWFHFNGVNWSRIQGQGLVAFKKMLTTELPKRYFEYRADLAKAANSAPEEKQKAINTKIARCTGLWEKLMCPGFLDEVTRMACLHFYDPYFEDGFDENKKLFCCKNGILDLEKLEFRSGRPEDRVTLSCGYDYDPTYTGDHPDVQDVVNFFKRVHVKPELFDYFFDILCLSLEGGNIHKSLYVHTGESGGGKTATFRLVHATFGEYCSSFPREIFIMGAQISASQARPELAQVRGRRLMFGAEVTQNERFNIGELKLQTGNDIRSVRSLWKENVNVKPQYSLWVGCNKPPTLPVDDEAFDTRLRFIPYESKFVLPSQESDYPIPKTETDQFKLKRFRADLQFLSEDNLKRLAPAMLWFIFKRYQEYKMRGSMLISPPSVIEAFERYKTLQDPIRRFFTLYIERDAEKSVSLSDMMKTFNDWHEKEFNVKPKISKVDFRENMVKRMKTEPRTAGNRVWWEGWGIKIFEKEDAVVLSDFDEDSPVIGMTLEERPVARTSAARQPARSPEVTPAARQPARASAARSTEAVPEPRQPARASAARPTEAAPEVRPAAKKASPVKKPLNLRKAVIETKATSAESEVEEETPKRASRATTSRSKGSESEASLSERTTRATRKKTPTSSSIQSRGGPTS